MAKRKYTKRKYKKGGAIELKDKISGKSFKIKSVFTDFSKIPASASFFINVFPEDTFDSYSVYRTPSGVMYAKKDKSYSDNSDQEFAKGGEVQKLTEKDFIQNKQFIKGNTLIKLKKLSNPDYYQAEYIDIIENEKIGSYGSSYFEDVVYDINTNIFAKGGVVESMDINFNNTFGISQNDFEKAIEAYYNTGSLDNAERVIARMDLVNLEKKLGKEKNKEVMEYVSQTFKDNGIFAKGGSVGDNEKFDVTGVREGVRVVISKSPLTKDEAYDLVTDAIKSGLYFDVRLSPSVFAKGGSIPDQIAYLEKLMQNRFLPASAVDTLKRMVDELKAKESSPAEAPAAEPAAPNKQVLESRLKLLKKMEAKNPSSVIKARIKLVTKMIEKAGEKFSKGGSVSGNYYVIQLGYSSREKGSDNWKTGSLTVTVKANNENEAIVKAKRELKQNYPSETFRNIGGKSIGKYSEKEYYESMEYAKGGSVGQIPKPIMDKINEINQLIEWSKDQPDFVGGYFGGTHYEYLDFEKPITTKNQFVYIEYNQGGGHKSFERYNVNKKGEFDANGLYELKHELSRILGAFRRAKKKADSGSSSANQEFAKGGSITPKVNQQITERAMEIYKANNGKTQDAFNMAFDQAIVEFGFNPREYHQTMKEIGDEETSYDKYAKGGTVHKSSFKKGDKVTYKYRVFEGDDTYIDFQPEVENEIDYNSNYPLIKLNNGHEFRWDGKGYYSEDIGTYLEKYAKGGVVGDSGTITDKNSLLLGKMATITADLGNVYQVSVLENGEKRTALVSKRGIKITPEFEQGGATSCGCDH